MSTPADTQEAAAAKLAVALKRMQEEVSTPRYAEMQKLVAIDHKIRFDAHIAAGFSEEQALKIIAA